MLSSVCFAIKYRSRLPFCVYNTSHLHSVIFHFSLYLRLIKRKNVYVLPHLYGELARHQDGLDLLEEENLIGEAVDTIVQANTDTFEDIFQLKAALWAMVKI